MNISSLSGLMGLQQQQSLQKTSDRVSAAIAALVGGKVSSVGDVASLSLASQLQAQVGSLRQLSGNLAQASSMAQVAGGGVEQIQNLAEEIQKLAGEASSPVLNEGNRKVLDEQFKQLLTQIDNIAANTSFGGKKLLNGDLSGADAISLGKMLSANSDNNKNSDSLEVGDLSVAALFGASDLSIASAADALNISVAAGSALEKIAAVRAGVGSFLESIDYAAASIDSAVANQDAARSVLQDSDLASLSSENAQANLQNNIALALAAQGNRISPAVIKLLG